jgi:integrase
VSISPDVIEVIGLHKQQQAAQRQFLGLAWVENDLVFTTGMGTPIHPRNLDRTWAQLQKKARAKRLVDLQEKLESESLLPEEKTILDAEIKAIEQGKLFPRIRLHDLRHLHASLAIKQGMDAKMLAERLGHSRASMTLDVYTHLFEEQRQKSAVNLKDALGTDQNESN